MLLENKPGGFVRRLHDGTWLGHVAEHIAIELQELAGTRVTYGKTRSTGEPGRYHVVYSYGEERVGLVERSRSSGDGRRRYVHLRPGALEGMVAARSVPPQVRTSFEV